MFAAYRCFDGFIRGGNKDVSILITKMVGHSTLRPPTQGLVPVRRGVHGAGIGVRQV